MKPSPPCIAGLACQSCLCVHLLLAQVYGEGTHLMLPWFERPIIYDVRARPSLIQSASGSKDLQMVRRSHASHTRRQRLQVTPSSWHFRDVVPMYCRRLV